MEVGIAIAFTAGIFSFLSPCVLPLVPSYLTFVTGMSLEDLQEGVNRQATMVHATLFVLGFSLIFVLLGASASFLGQFFRHYELWIARVGGGVIMILGLHLTGVFRLTALLQEKRIHLRNKPAGYLGTVGVGMAFGAGWTPCIGPILGSILLYASLEATMTEGMLLLGTYALGLGVPFVGASVGLNWFLAGSVKARTWIVPLQRIAGTVLIIIGLLMVTGRFVTMTAFLAGMGQLINLDL